MTADNLTAPWILFETGALSKTLKESNVCTLLLGSVTPSDINGPLAGFQHTLFRQDEVRKLVLTLNAYLESSGLAENVILRVFEKWWPDLEKQVFEELRKVSGVKNVVSQRTEIDLLKELLDLTRYVARNTKDTTRLVRWKMK